MVLIRPGNLAGEARGSIGGQTFSRNRGGMYVRSRATPTNTITPARTTIRSQFANTSSSWQTALSQAQRDSWDAWAELAPEATSVNKLGDTIRIGGKAAYQRLNVRLLQAGLSPVTDPPINNAPFSPIFTSLAADTDPSVPDLNLVLTTAAAGAANKVQLFAGPTIAPGASILQKNQLRLVANSALNGTATTGSATYPARYGYPTIGARSSFAMRMISEEGLVSDLVELGQIAWQAI